MPEGLGDLSVYLSDFGRLADINAYCQALARVVFPGLETKYAFSIWWPALLADAGLSVEIERDDNLTAQECLSLLVFLQGIQERVIDRVPVPSGRIQQELDDLDAAVERVESEFV